MERVAIELVRFPPVRFDRLPPEVSAVHVVADSKYLILAGLIKGRNQLEAL
jgi:hypothetical protein